MAKLNPKGKKWYGKKGDGTYSHDLGWWGMITIWDYDPDLVLQAKAGKLHFNEGSNNYFKMHISYLKKNFGLNACLQHKPSGLPAAVEVHKLHVHRRKHILSV